MTPLFPPDYDSGQLTCRAYRMGLSCGVRPDGVCVRLWGAIVWLVRGLLR